MMTGDHVGEACMMQCNVHTASPVLDLALLALETLLPKQLSLRCVALHTHYTAWVRVKTGLIVLVGFRRLSANKL